MSVLSAVAVDIYKQNTEGFKKALGIISWLFGFSKGPKGSPLLKLRQWLIFHECIKYFKLTVFILVALQRFMDE